MRDIINYVPCISPHSIKITTPIRFQEQQEQQGQQVENAPEEAAADVAQSQVTLAQLLNNQTLILNNQQLILNNLLQL